ncbi:hypothetical protein BDQ12DRAFT_693756 [Crucibulum laeve]|uniref:Uncharacterized protein n=1 Tax=Crucibulum laeve TaxID=68775 RepID=A0A5C3LEY4_9AGAR|nr:hypothetical protein BDQ12DRAFT_693756 [Crucibulum laeve]
MKLEHLTNISTLTVPCPVDTPWNMRTPPFWIASSLSSTPLLQQYSFRQLYLEGSGQPESREEATLTINSDTRHIRFRHPLNDDVIAAHESSIISRTSESSDDSESGDGDDIDFKLALR